MFGMERKGGKGKETGGRDCFSTIWLEEMDGKENKLNPLGSTIFNLPKPGRNGEKSFGNYHFTY